MQKARVKGKWGTNAVITEKGDIVEPRMLGEGLRPSAVTRDLKWGVEIPIIGNAEEDKAMSEKVICEFFTPQWLIPLNGIKMFGYAVIQSSPGLCS